MGSLARVVGVGLIFVAAGTPSGNPVASAQSRGTVTASDQLEVKWVAAVRAHHIGVADEPAQTVSAWPVPTISAVIARFIEIETALKAANDRDARTGRLDPFTLRRRAVTRADILGLLNLPNDDKFAIDPVEMVERAAMLHADIAILVKQPSPPAGVSPLVSQSLGAGRIVRRTAQTIQTSDGTVQGTQDNSVHFEFARSLLDAEMRLATDADRAWVDDWYRATSAWLMYERRWSAADQHLQHARQLFPNDGRLWFYSGVTHEVMAGPV